MATASRAAGDFNGDGLADLIIGADDGHASHGADAGRSYVWSSARPAAAAPSTCRRSPPATAASSSTARRR
ncbi:MAG: FG-GAP repeat protein [Candidatus Accumulibacter meliphilus]|uniref:FG-GAP repeat protein n=1 Tax=Candidatus Accumulibacter meliphilus TaxID=2211374 RepID=UPI002FC306F2